MKEFGEVKVDQHLKTHELKIQQTEQVLQQLLIPRDITQEWRNGERQTLESKLTELQQQRGEFLLRVNDIIKQLSDLQMSDSFCLKLNAVQMKLGIEMTRLDNSLPIYARRKEIVDVVVSNPVTIVLGETGSGKSTQMPQYLYEAGLAKTGVIVCTQPRKIAATSLATRVASELIGSVGQTVGYKVGMRQKTSALTKIVYMTDHMLLNEILDDPVLSKVSCVIIDEAHERSIYTDLLLGMVKKCMVIRPELKVVITSATIDPDVFVRYFKGCPDVKVSGRTFPVEVIWQDPALSVPFESYMQRAVNVAADIHQEDAEGDILVFMTSPLETEKCCSLLDEKLKPRNDFKCLQIHGKLQAEEQQAVFQPLAPGVRKIVFATNSAETSVTIPGIKYVIDSGLVKEMKYDPEKNLSSLDTVVISKSSAEQRKGRAGRMSPGKCFRLYMEEDYEKMKSSLLPEILRVHLAQALLKLMDLGVDPTDFNFVESPPQAALGKAIESLEDLGASKGRVITELGRRLALLPFEPRLGKFLLTGIDCGIAYEAISLAALTTMGSSIFYRAVTDADKHESDLKKTKFCHEEGDHFAMLSVYQEWYATPEKEKSKWCVKNRINDRSMRMVREMANEVITVLKKEMKLEVKVSFAEVSESHLKLKKIIFQASKQNLAVYLGNPKVGYFAPHSKQQAQIHPSSSVMVLGGKKPEWVLFEQLINTSKDFFTSVSPVDRDLVLTAYGKGELSFDPSLVEKMKVSPVLTMGLGRFSFMEFVGRRFCNLKQIEIEVMSEFNVEIVCVDADRKRLEIQVHVSGNKAICVNDVVDRRLGPIFGNLRLADREIPLHEKSAGLRAVLGRGGVVSKLLFPGEYRTVFIDEVSPIEELTKVREKLEKYGTVAEVNPFLKRLKTHPQRWGTVTFKSPESAVKAVKDMMDSDVARIVPCASPGRVGKVGEFTLKVTLTRRKLRGSGFITLTNPEDMPRLLHCGDIMIDKSIVKVGRDMYNKDRLHVFSLPPSANEEKIRVAIDQRLGALPGETLVKDIRLIRERGSEPSPGETSAMKEYLETSLSELCPNKQVTIEVVDPTAKSVFQTAYLKIANPNDGLKVFNEIKGKLFISSEPLNVQQDLSSDVFIPKYLLGVLETELKTLETKFKTSDLYGKVNINIKRSRAGHCYVRIESENPESLAVVKRDYDALLEGRSPDLSEFGQAFEGLFRKEGRDRLNSIEKSTDTIIRTNFYLQRVSVIGSDENCQKAFDKIKGYVKLLVNYHVQSTLLSGDNRPAGLMKKLLSKYGFDLAKLRQESGVEAVELNFRRQLLTTTGTEESLKKVVALVQECISQLETANVMPPKEENECPLDCVVCFCPIDRPYRLNLCGHAYCLDCIKLQVRTAIDTRDLPLRCAYEGCDQNWCWRDVEELVVACGSNIVQLARAAMDKYVSERKTEFSFCLTPDCPGVFPVSRDGKLFLCEGCNMRICTACQVQYHDDLTCAMYQSEKRDQGLDQWMESDTANHKKCPGCKAYIQKAGGCNKVTCKICSVEICWVCLETFETESQCYAHLKEQHGAFGDEYVHVM
ncbi:uncharacterized protein LOC135476324 [Liolophura sinensis]|uniref:uncharacterized protein LOC135476324 n=1 Tax=Liolophura sinensis TaxID=3198878 RepID=UPI0031588F7D